MCSYGKQSALDSLLTWLQKQENNKLLKSLEREYNASHYEALCTDTIINTTSKKDIINMVVRYKTKIDNVFLSDTIFIARYPVTALQH